MSSRGLFAMILLGALSPAYSAPVGDTQSPSTSHTPWEAPDSVIVLDAYQGNRVDLARVSTDPHHVAAVIWQSSIGCTDTFPQRCSAGERASHFHVDGQFLQMAHSAQARHFPFGAYHFGVTGHVEDQARQFVDLIRQTGTTYIALDIDGDSAPNISLPEAEAFLTYVHDHLGRWPAVYTNLDVAATISGRYGPSSAFGHTTLWVASPTLNMPPPGHPLPTNIWPAYTLWQFTSDDMCNPHRGTVPPRPCPVHIQGIDPGTDVNVFNGTPQALAALFGQ